MTWLGLAACASNLDTGAKYDPLERFPKHGLWVWDANANVLPEGPRYEGLDLAPLFEETIAEAFAARGYQKGKGEAHYRLSYQFAVGTRLRPEESIAVGSLSIQLSEVKTKRPIWVGFARAELDVSRTPEQRREALRTIVDEMLAGFPPGHEE